MQTEAISSQPQPSIADQRRAVRILAKSLYRDLKTQGFCDKQVVALATELLGAVTSRKPVDDQE